MSQPTIYLHIGMPKAASSYLHGTIFPVLMPEQYLMLSARNAKKPGYQFHHNAFSVRRFSDSFHQRSDFWHQYGDEFLKRFLSPFLSDDRELRSVLISDEAVTRLNHFNIRRMPSAFNRYEIENNFRLFDQAARRIGFNRTKVLLVIRRQDYLLASSYAQLSRKIVGASQEDFERRIHQLINYKLNTYKTSFYSVDYYELYQCLARSLTKENIMVLPLEEFSYYFSRIIKKLTDFFAIKESRHLFSQTPVNSRSAGDNKWGLRPLLLFKSPQANFEITAPRHLTGRAKNIELTSALSNAIMNYYAGSNRRLDKVLDADLYRFGYCL